MVVVKGKEQDKLKLCVIMVTKPEVAMVTDPSIAVANGQKRRGKGQGDWVGVLVCDEF